MKKRFIIIIGTITVIIAVTVLLVYFLLPFSIHSEIIEQSRAYEEATLFSVDERYILHTERIDDESGVFASFSVLLAATNEILYICPDKYRTIDLKGIDWDGASHNVIVSSGDVGTIIYPFAFSDTQYSSATGKHYEETANGYKAATYEKYEIEIEKINSWILSCAQAEGYYQFIYSDADSWDMFIYYSPYNMEFNIKDFKFSVDDSIVRVYVTSTESTDASTDYMLFRIQAPLRGVWPTSSELYLNGIQIDKQDS